MKTDLTLMRGAALQNMSKAVDAIYKASNGDNNLARVTLGHSAAETQLGAGPADPGHRESLQPWNNPMSISGTMYNSDPTGVKGANYIDKTYPSYQDKVDAGVDRFRGLLNGNYSSSSIYNAITTYAAGQPSIIYQRSINSISSVTISAPNSVITNTLSINGHSYQYHPDPCAIGSCYSPAPPPRMSPR